MDGQVSVFDVLRDAPVAGARAAIRPLTLEELGALVPFRSTVWIETRPWATQQVTEEMESYRFFLLFGAEFLWTGQPIGEERRHYHFKYLWHGVTQYNYCRVDEFYGREWRVWPERPTDEERRTTEWIE